ncbi:MAG: penicillin-binding protein [Verrucomicrobiota bacterium]|jgi:penicillin-binding protein 1C
MNRRTILKRSTRVALAMVVTTAFCWWVLPFLVPLPPKLLEPLPVSPVYLAADGSPLRQLLSDEGQRTAMFVPYDEIPRALIQATLSAEDKRFFSHAGIDLPAIARAAWDNLQARRVVSGASTLTQQLVKVSADKKAPRSLVTKIRETLQARHLEMIWDKQRILTEYLNRVSYGNLLTGCRSAAQGYFEKPLQDLTAAEAATLAALPQSPTRLNPHKNLKAVQKRQQLILDLMVKNGWLTPADKELAEKEKLSLQTYSGGFTAPHAVALATGREGIIRTTIDKGIQSRVEQIIHHKLSLLAGKHVTQAAAVVIENKTGHVLALVGSRDFFASGDGQINGAWTPHSPGSALKPFTYLLALEKGFTAASIIPDLPIEYATPTGLYRPENYDHRLHGPVTLRNALGNSLNIPAVRVLQRMGGEAVLHDALKNLGISTLDQAPEHYGLGLTIGNASVRLVELANAYACLARLGEYRPWTLEMTGPSSTTTRLYPENTAYILTDILSDNQARVMTFGPHSVIKMPFRCAVKTGTSTNYRDNWTLGYTPEFTVGVWVGNFDNTPMNDVSGITGAAPIFRDIFLHLHEIQAASWYAAPASLAQATIDPRNGLSLNASSPATRMSKAELFVDHTVPASAKDSDYEKETGKAYIPVEYSAWLKREESSLSGLFALRESTPGNARPQIITPADRTVFFLDPDLKEGGSKLLLAASPEDSIVWSSATLDVFKIGGQHYVKLVPGTHEIAATNPGTETASRVTIEVKEPLSLAQKHSRFASANPDTPVRQQPEDKQ